MPSAADTTIVVVTTYDAYNAMSSSGDLTVQGAASAGAGVYSAVVGPYLNLNTATGAGNLAGINLIAAFVTVSKINADSAAGNDIALGDVIGLVGTGVTTIAAVAAVATGVVASPALITALGLISAIGALHANQRGYTVNGLADDISDLINTASAFTPRVDPLTLDLDGDGLETIGIDPANPILFDHDGDGVKTATGWIKPDDGFLVLDRNGNGRIDTGRELFGDSTPLYAGGTAVDGFAALAQEDTNFDGRVDANDARFANLRIWRDANQNGISEAGELTTLAANGIVSLHTAKTENATLLENGNQIADLGSYAKADGSTGSLVEIAGEMADIDLIEDTFHSRFTDSIPLTETAKTLPSMNGSGQVRNLRDAANDGLWERAA